MMLTRSQKRNEKFVPRDKYEAKFNISDKLFDSLSTKYREELIESYEIVENFFHKLPSDKKYFFQKNQTQFYNFFGKAQTKEQTNKVIDLFYLIKNTIPIKHIFFEKIQSQNLYGSTYAASTYEVNEIYLTEKFFELKPKYKAECIIHELTHIFGNTEDYCIDETTAIPLSDNVENSTFSFGGKEIIIPGSLIGNITYKNLERSREAIRSRVKVLADKFPEKAINNAYNYEFFAASILPKNCGKQDKEQLAPKTTAPPFVPSPFPATSLPENPNIRFCYINSYQLNTSITYYLAGTFNNWLRGAVNTNIAPLPSDEKWIMRYSIKGHEWRCGTYLPPGNYQCQVFNAIRFYPQSQVKIFTVDNVHPPTPQHLQHTYLM